jgi:predicted transposase YdaD
MPFISPTEQLWLDKGFVKGRAEGRTEGIVEGRTEGIVEGLIRGIEIGLEVRFGEAGLELMPRLQTVNDVAVLESFLRAINDAPTLDALQRLLPPENQQ